MTAPRWTHVEDLFVRALEQPDTARVGFVHAQAAGDPELAAEVLSLLDSAGEAGASIQHAIGAEIAQLTHAWTERSGERIGPYRLAEQLGEGGMGVVYAAIRDDAHFKQVAAIKILRRGLGSLEAIARFRDERQILASLEHPNIVRLFDGGTTEDHLPYIVMERVHGSSITRHATERTLSVADRIRLFADVCFAVQYAHDRGVIHRDLKPSNILVDATGTPKLLDFGVAKLVAAEAEREAHTRTGAVMFTPEYASPEQARGEPTTAASDVYSLGAVLYELLTGRPPHTGTTLEIIPKIADEDPPRPSTVAVDGRRQLAGDLDEIMAMALRKEPARRYPSAEALGDDLHRHLAGLPVHAHAPSRGYRARKLVRRHRAKLVVAGALLVSAGVTTRALLIGRERTSAPPHDTYARRGLPIHIDGVVSSVGLTNDGRTMFYADRYGPWTFDLASEQVERPKVTYDEATPTPDGHLMLVRDTKFFLADLDGSKATELPVHPTKRFGVSLPVMSPDGSRVATIQEDHWLVVFDRRTGQTRRLFDTTTENGAAEPRWSTDGALLVWESNREVRRLYATRVADGFTDMLRLPILAHTTLINSAGFLPDGRIIYCADDASGPSIRLRAVNDRSGVTEEIVSPIDRDVATCTIATAPTGRVVVELIYGRPRAGWIDLDAPRPELHVLGVNASRDQTVAEMAQDGSRVFAVTYEQDPGELHDARAFSTVDSSDTVLPTCPGDIGLVHRGDSVLHVELAASGEETIARLRSGRCELVDEWRLPRATWTSLTCGERFCITSRHRDGRLEVWKLDGGSPRGRELARLDDLSITHRPQFGISPEANRLIALAGEGAAPQLIDTETGVVSPISMEGLPEIADVQSVRWSRDPEHFLISAMNFGENYGVLRVGLDGKRETVWSSETDWFRLLATSRTSSKIAGMSRSFRSEFVVLDPQ